VFLPYESLSVTGVTRDTLGDKITRLSPDHGQRASDAGPLGGTLSVPASLALRFVVGTSGDHAGTTRDARKRTQHEKTNARKSHVRGVTCGNGYPNVLGVKGSSVQIRPSRQVKGHNPSKVMPFFVSE
jgi:hypothetical protein